jgi:hypothetical protein
MVNSGKSVNIEEIVDEIRHDALKRGYLNDDVVFSDIPGHVTLNRLTHSADLEENIQKLGNQCNVPTHRVLSTSRTFGAMIIFLRKVMRKLLKFYIEPIVIDQNSNNRLIASCLRDLYLDLEALKLRVKYLEEMNDNYKREIDSFRSEESDRT